MRVRYNVKSACMGKRERERERERERVCEGRSEKYKGNQIEHV
jgi:hypothetical protein